MATNDQKRKTAQQKNGAPTSNMLGNFVLADAGNLQSDAPLGNFEASNKVQDKDDPQYRKRTEIRPFSLLLQCFYCL